MTRFRYNLVYGVGINDADYVVQRFETVGYTESGKQIQKPVWICPYYSRWVSVLRRCYSANYHLTRPTYKGCSIAKEWHSFMTFKAWMCEQNWEGKHLDKDILFPGNKIYGPDTCVFVDPIVNTFMLERTAARGEWPIGVYFDKAKGKYRALCQDATTRKQKSLGYFNDPEEAHQAWLTEKLKQAKIIADQQTDIRIAEALIERYENYGKDL